MALKVFACVPCMLVFLASGSASATMNLDSPWVWGADDSVFPANPTVFYEPSMANYRVVEVRRADGENLNFREGPLCVPTSWLAAPPLSDTTPCPEDRRAGRTRVLQIDVEEPGRITVHLESTPGTTAKPALFRGPPVTRSLLIDPRWSPPLFEPDRIRPSLRSPLFEVQFPLRWSSFEVPRSGGSSRSSRLFLRPIGFATEIVAGPGEISRRADDRGVALDRRRAKLRDIDADTVVRLTPLWPTGEWGVAWEGRPFDLPCYFNESDARRLADAGGVVMSKNVRGVACHAPPW